jgi:hypothetical protein
MAREAAGNLRHRRTGAKYRLRASKMRTSRRANMRILATAILLLGFASQDALAVTRRTVAIAVDSSSLAGKLADDVQESTGPRVLAALAEIMSAPDPIKIDLTLVNEPGTSDRILACAGAECMQDLGQTAGVDLVIKVKVRTKQVSTKPAKKSAEKAKADYQISIIAVRSAPQRDVWSEKTECLACEAGEIGPAASLLAGAVGEQIKATLTLAKPAPEAAPAPAPVPKTPPPPTPALESTQAPATPAPDFYVPKSLSVTALAGGVLLLGSGIYLVHIHGKGTCDLAAQQDLCAQRYRTKNLGIGLIAGGGLATLGGLVGLIFFPPGSSSAPMALDITGSSISLSGNF